MSHRKYYKGGLNLSAVQTLLRHVLYTAAMQSACFFTRRQHWARPLPVGRRARKEVAEEDEEVLGGLLLLKPPLGSSSQHPATQGHSVRGRAFRGEKAL